MLEWVIYGGHIEYPVVQKPCGEACEAMSRPWSIMPGPLLGGATHGVGSIGRAFAIAGPRVPHASRLAPKAHGASRLHKAPTAGVGAPCSGRIALCFGRDAPASAEAAQCSRESGGIFIDF